MKSGAALYTLFDMFDDITSERDRNRATDIAREVSTRLLADNANDRDKCSVNSYLWPEGESHNFHTICFTGLCRIDIGRMIDPVILKYKKHISNVRIQLVHHPHDQCFAPVLYIDILSEDELAHCDPYQPPEHKPDRDIVRVVRRIVDLCPDTPPHTAGLLELVFDVPVVDPHWRTQRGMPAPNIDYKAVGEDAIEFCIPYIKWWDYRTWAMNDCAAAVDHLVFRKAAAEESHAARHVHVKSTEPVMIITLRGDEFNTIGAPARYTLPIKLRLEPPKRPRPENKTSIAELVQPTIVGKRPINEKIATPAVSDETPIKKSRFSIMRLIGLS